MLLNYTNRALLFVHKDNLTQRGNGRYEIELVDQLIEREYMRVAGQALRVHLTSQVTQLTFGIPVVQEVITGVDPIPEGDDLLIVSKQYAEACRRLCRPTHRLRVVCGGVYTSGLPFPVAATGIATVEACLPYSSPELFEDAPSVDYVIDQIRAGLLKPVVEPAAILRKLPIGHPDGPAESKSDDHLPFFNH